MPDPLAISPVGDPAPHVFALAERDEYGPITGRPGGLFTAAPAALVTGSADPLGRPPSGWVPAEHLL